MPQQFVKYKSFNDKALAMDLYTRLEKEGIPVAWEDSEGFFDASFANYDLLNNYYIKLKPEDFKRADEFLEKEMNENFTQPPGDYYLFSFTDAELQNILKEPLEWNEFDRYWAKRILASKGIQAEQTEIAEAREQQAEILRKPWKLDKAWILGVTAFMLLAFYFFHIFSAFATFFFGIYITFGKKTLPNGTRVFAFSESDRSAGKIVLATGIMLMLLILLIALRIIDIRLFAKW